MKLKDCFVTHETMGKQILVDTENKTFSGIVRSNKTAAFIVDCLKNETTPDEIINLMLEKYDADRDTIEKDVNKVIEKLNGIGALE